MKKTKLCLIAGLAAMTTMLVPNNAKAYSYFKTNKYKITEGENKIVTNIDIKNHTVETILSNIEPLYSSSLTLKVYNTKNEEVTGKKEVGTNYSIKALSTTSGYEMDTVKIVLYGDTNGDGKINATDALSIIKNKTGKVKFENEFYEEAGRITKATRQKGNTPTSTDALAIIKYKLGVTQISQYYEDEAGKDSDKAQALKKAKDYLRFMSFSREGLIEQLQYEGFTYDASVYAVDNCNADWNEQALKKAKSYLETIAFSKEGLIEQLEFEGFTTEQSKYGVDNCGADWNEQAIKKAKSYLETIAFSEEGLIEQLEFEGFTTEQSKYGVNNCGANWNEQAVKKAKSYLESNILHFTKDELIEQLEFEGFTREQAEYGVAANGL